MTTNGRLRIETLAGAADEDVWWFCRELDDATAVAARLRRYLRSGSVRPSWCFRATASTGRIAGRHWWWSAPGASAPAGVDLISVEDAAGALESLRHARDALGVREAICEIDAGSGRASLLRDAGGPVTPIDTSAKGRDDRRDSKSPAAPYVVDITPIIER
jgi:hypothetical protein